MHRVLMLMAALMATSAWADVLNISASERGDVFNSGTACTTGEDNDGASPGNFYTAGGFPDAAGQCSFRDWFEFSIPGLSGGTLTSATLELYEPSASDSGPAPGDGHYGGALTFSVYGLTAQPITFSDITTSNLFGSITTTSADNGTIVDIQLNSAALAAIAGDQLQNLFIGGVDSAETGAGADFQSTDTFLDPSSTSVLSLNVDPATTVPEPCGLAWLLPAMLIPAILRRNLRRA